jgi:hypothetical protein
LTVEEAMNPQPIGFKVYVGAGEKSEVVDAKNAVAKEGYDVRDRQTLLY